MAMAAAAAGGAAATRVAVTTSAKVAAADRAVRMPVLRRTVQSIYLNYGFTIVKLTS